MGRAPQREVSGVDTVATLARASQDVVFYRDEVPDGYACAVGLGKSFLAPARFRFPNARDSGDVRDHDHDARNGRTGRRHPTRVTWEAPQTSRA
jgi:hypothetical protein